MEETYAVIIALFPSCSTSRLSFCIQILHKLHVVRLYRPFPPLSARPDLLVGFQILHYLQHTIIKAVFSPLPVRPDLLAGLHVIPGHLPLPGCPSIPSKLSLRPSLWGRRAVLVWRGPLRGTAGENKILISSKLNKEIVEFILVSNYMKKIS